MIKSSIKVVLAGIVMLAIAAMPLQAAGQPNKEAGEAAGAAKSNRVIPFRGKLSSKTDSSITVGSRTFEVNAETKIMKDGRPATLADAVLGEMVGGAYREQDGKLMARSIRLGPKPEADAGGKAQKPKNEKTAE